MTFFKFEGDTEDFSEPQMNLVKNILEKRGFKNTAVNIEPVGKQGDNYIAFVKRITVKTENEPFRMIAKVAPRDELLRAPFSTGLLFKNEIIIYSEVLDMYRVLLNSEELPKEDTFRMPKCYGFITEAPNEIIVLEDLQMSQFVMLDKLQPLTDASVKLVMKDFAIFHSLSYVLQNKYPDKFNQIKVGLVNIWTKLDDTDDLKKWFLQLEDDLILKMHNYKHKKYIRGALSQLSSTAAQIYGYDLVSKHSVIQQGDCWTNNILFRLENKTPVESVMIDYQVSKAASPAMDLLYFIFSCTDYETRSKHYYEWLDYYYANLTKSLNNFKLQVTQVYPRDQLNDDLRRHGKFGLSLSIIIASVMVRESNENTDFKDDNELQTKNSELTSFKITKLDEKTLERLITKVKGCIDSVVDFGYV